MVFGLPSIGELAWGQKILDSINFLKGEQDGRLSEATLSATLANAVPVTKFGATGDGVTNDNAALNAATANGGPVYVPPGTYLADAWVISQPTQLIFAPGAVLKQRTTPVTVGGVASLLKFTTGADGSTIVNAQIDGNRDALGAGHVAQEFWIGLRVEYCDDVKIIGGEFYNVMAHAIYITGSGNGALPASRITVRDVWVHDSAQALGVAAVHDSLFSNIRATDMSNNGFLVWQHPFEFRLLKRVDVEHLYLDGFAPDANAQDSLSQGLGASRIEDDCTFSHIHFTGYQGTGSIKGMGASFGASKRLKIHDFHISDFHYGLELTTVQESSISNVFIDGAYKTGGTYGIRLYGAGWTSGVIQGRATSHSNAPSARVVVSDCSVRRCTGAGIDSTARDIEFRNVRCIGNAQYGFLIRSVADNSTNFPGQIAPRADNVVLDGCQAIGNGYSGLYAGTNTDVTVVGGNYLNNGQNTGAPDKDGIFSVAPSNQIAVLSSPGLYDDQTWTKTNGGSILPGAYAGEVTMLMLDTSGMYVGQYVTVKNIGGPGVDATVKVKDIYNDEVTFDYTGTVSETGNLIALTGTVSSTATALTGTGTAFNTELIGPTYVKVGAGYPVVHDVASDTSAVISGGATVAAGATIERVAFTVEAVPSQRYGLTLSGAFTRATVGRIIDRSNVTRSYNFTLANLSACTPGTLLTIVSTGISVSGGATAAVSQAIPAGWRIVGWKIDVTTAISGGGVTSYDVKMYDDGVAKDTYATTRALTVGTENHGAVGTEVYSSGLLRMVFNGGVPTSGVVNTETLIERCGV